MPEIPAPSILGIDMSKLNRESIREIPVRSNWKPLEPATIDEKFYGDEVFMNDLYQVIVRRHADNLIHLSIKRRDKSAVRNWRHFQYIKNELCGEESFGFEVYPPESCLVDTANQYHLWVTSRENLPDFCFNQRLVSEVTILNAKQELWEGNMRPKDLMSKEDLDAQVEVYRREIEEGK